MALSAKTKICLIIGDPVDKSLSPAMHNAGYGALGIDEKFVYIGATVKKEKLKEAILGVRALNIWGLTCTIPHKVAVMKHLDSIDETVEKIGAVNTVLNRKGILTGYNTDWLGIVRPLEKFGAIKGKKIAVLGSGGAARAAIFGLQKRGGKVAVFGLDIREMKSLERSFRCKIKSLSMIDEVKDFDIIINTTPVGSSQSNGTLVPRRSMSSSQIIFDIVYFPHETRLLKDAKEKGSKIIHGSEMLLQQGLAQFEIYTGRKAPEKAMRKILEDSIMNQQ